MAPVADQHGIEGNGSTEDESTCFHCGQPVLQGAEFSVTWEGKARPMCCPGCQAVAHAIIDGGMQDFYRYRTESSPNASILLPEALKQIELYDRPDLQSRFVYTDKDNHREAALILEGIVCAACVWLNERYVNSLPGVLEFRVNYSTHRARVQWDETKTKLSSILKAIAAIGYLAHPFDPDRQEELQVLERRTSLKRIAIAGLAMMQVMMLAVALYTGVPQGMDPSMQGFLRWVSFFITLPVVLYSAQPFFKGAWRELGNARLSMDVPVALAIGLAFLASAYATLNRGAEVYFDSVTMFVFFLLTGRFLEMKARHRAGEAVDALIRLLPTCAMRLMPNGETEAVTVSELNCGDRLLIKPGETLPADGRVVEGVSSVDEALMTGESMPIVKKSGDVLVGGSVNMESPLVMVIEKLGQDTFLAAIVRLLDRAQSERPRIALLADRVAGWFVGALLLLAVVVAWWWWKHAPDEAFRVTLSVLVVTCPCALSLATPAAMTAATSTLTRLGVLTTRGHALEVLAGSKHIVFDKTGTLTYGKIKIAGVTVYSELSEKKALNLAAALESRSEHPVARAFDAHRETALQTEAFRNVPGSGIEGTIEGIQYRLGTYAFLHSMAPLKSLPEPDEVKANSIYLGDASGILASFSLTDQLRAQARETVDRFHAMNIKVTLLSGDSPAVVSAVAENLGIKDFQSAMSPADKLNQIRLLQASGERIIMVGDGVNDTPVLAGADVSIAMGSGTQLAQSNADMVLFSEHLPHLADAVKLARRSLRIVRQNLTWAVVYNMLALPAAAMGLVQPWMAAIGMSVSSLLVVLNALRLLNFNKSLAKPNLG